MRAEWNPKERVERNPLRWVYRRWKRVGKVDKALTLLPGIGVYLMAEPTTLLGQVTLPLFASVFSLAIGTFFAFQAGLSGYDSGQVLTNDPPPEPEVDVDVLVERDGTLIGEDRGRLTEVSGWLIFTGHRTSFSVRSHHCKPLRWRRPNWDGLRLTTRQWAVLDIKGDIQSTVQIRHCASRDEKVFDGIIGRWKFHKVVSDGVPVFPPDHPHREAFLFPWAKIAVLTLLSIFWLLMLVSSPRSEWSEPKDFFSAVDVLTDWCFSYVAIPMLAVSGLWESVSKLKNLRFYRRQFRRAKEAEIRPLIEGTIRRLGDIAATTDTESESLRARRV